MSDYAHVVDALEQLDLSHPDNIILFNRGVVGLLMLMNHEPTVTRVTAAKGSGSPPLLDYANDLNAAYALLGEHGVTLDREQFESSTVYFADMSMWVNDQQVAEHQTPAAALTIACLRAMDALASTQKDEPI